MTAHTVKRRKHTAAGNGKHAELRRQMLRTADAQKADAEESSHLGRVCHERVQPPTEQHVEEEACGEGQGQGKGRSRVKGRGRGGGRRCRRR
jgi:hypothetical protein